MMTVYSADEVLEAVARLSRSQLLAFVEAEIVIPVMADSVPLFRKMDVVRIELLCDLAQEFELDTEALGIVMPLVDRLHGIRAELRAVLDAVAKEAPEVRARIGEAARRARMDKETAAG